MVQVNENPQPSIAQPNPTSNESVFDGMPVPHAEHRYDGDRDVSTTRTTLEYPGGLVVTTTVEVRLKHPHGYAVLPSGGITADSEQAEDAHNVPSPVAPLLPTYRVPLPTSFSRPPNEEDYKRFYVIIAGKEVGIFLGDWDEVVTPLVRGVPGNRVEGYGTFDDAVYQYARAYQRKRPEWRVRVIGNPRPVEWDDSYHWGDGEMLGSVDITGLDIRPEFVTTVA
ncbi:hypothetical protein V5O48_015976 [Marasmius crinis-equi]|uniref:Uncharacterized protein n=1 Tax=Marasmius crinis-equi TaxID=585013 RepID=A0ABR3ET15_9AGAR